MSGSGGLCNLASSGILSLKERRRILCQTGPRSRPGTPGKRQALPPMEKCVDEAAQRSWRGVVRAAGDLEMLSDVDWVWTDWMCKLADRAMVFLDSRKLWGVTPVEESQFTFLSLENLLERRLTAGSCNARPEWRRLSTGGCQAPSIRETLERHRC